MQNATSAVALVIGATITLTEPMKGIAVILINGDIHVGMVLKHMD